MKQIDPSKPYHTRSPYCEAEIGGKDENGNWWGRIRKKEEYSAWYLIAWNSEGKTTSVSIIFDYDATGLIQEPEVEENVKKTNIMVLLRCRGCGKVYNAKYIMPPDVCKCGHGFGSGETWMEACR
jgi:hypothetical protein